MPFLTVKPTFAASTAGSHASSAIPSRRRSPSVLKLLSIRPDAGRINLGAYDRPGLIRINAGARHHRIMG